MSELRYSTWAAGLRRSDIANVLSAAKQPGMLSLAPGVPFPDAYPTEKVAEVVARIVRDEPETIFPYGDPQGSIRGRESVVYRMAKRGVTASPDSVVMTTGSQNACDMVLRLIAEPGDTLIIEAPTFLGVLDSIKNWGLNLVEVPSDRDGIDTAFLRETLERLRRTGVTPKAIYLMSNYHNPAGTMISPERRRELPRIAEEFNTFVIEDDAYSELTYDDVDQTPIKAYDDTGNVIYLGSFSKLVAPGFRVGWAVVNDELVRTWNICRPMFEVGAPAINQEIVAALHEDGWLDAHIGRLIEGYRSRRDAMLGAIREYFPAECSWTATHGGFYSWVTVPDRVDLDSLFRTAVAKKVMYFTGNFFYLDHRHHNHFRLCFSRPDEPTIREAVRRLASALDEELAKTA